MQDPFLEFFVTFLVSKMYTFKNFFTPVQGTQFTIFCHQIKKINLGLSYLLNPNFAQMNLGTIVNHYILLHHHTPIDQEVVGRWVALPNCPTYYVF